MKRTLLCVWVSLCLIFALLPAAHAESPENYLENKRFTFSPLELTERFEKIAKETFADFQYEVTEGDGYSLILDWGAAVEDAQYMLQFFHEDSQSFTKEEAQDPGVWCVYLLSAKQTDESPLTMLSKEMLWTFCQVCDPSMTEKDFQDLLAANIVSHMNTLNGEEPFGYYQTSGGFYEFQHIFLFTEEMSAVTDGLGIYGADWRAEE